MGRIDNTFKKLAEQGKTALIPYITAGDPGADATVGFMQALVKAGADILELGIPFSDPSAEGPVIQKAMERALGAGMTVEKVLAMVVEFRKTDSQTPIVLMGYLNPIEKRGYGVFAKMAKEAGVDAVLTVDIPPVEASEYSKAMHEQDLDTIFLVAPTSTETRIKEIAQACSGFIYYVSLKGVTGVKAIDADDVATNLARVRKHSSIPIGVGFGIRDAETAQTVAKISDAVVVGSALVKKIEENSDNISRATDEMAALLSSMREAMDAVKK